MNILSQEEIDALLDVCEEDLLFDDPEELKELYRLVDKIPSVYRDKDLGKINFQVKNEAQNTAKRLKLIMELQKELDRVRTIYPEKFV